jgi:acetolactate synthase-1/2/3 large subunit
LKSVTQEGRDVLSRTCADVVAETLYTSGVRFAFGHPGGEVVDLIEALELQGIKFVLTGHESAAAFMAATVGRLTGVPGVCLATLGPGACNLILGVGCALLDRDPLLAISARTVAKLAEVSDKQNLPLNDLFAPISKASISLSGRDTKETIRQALSLATRPPRGPVYLSLANDVAVSPEGPSSEILVEEEFAETIYEEVENIAGAVNDAKRPIAVIGISLDPRGDSPAVREFLSATGIPYVVLPQAKGVADEFGPGYLGTVASAAADAILVGQLESSDCLLGIGFDPVESAQEWHYAATLYNIANWSIARGPFRPEVECLGDVSGLLKHLQTKCEPDTDWTERELAELKLSVQQAMVPEVCQGSGGMSPISVMDRLNDLLPEETVIATDVGAHKMLISQTWNTATPNGFLVSNGLSSMGYGVPAALCASLLDPDRRVVGVFGDGGFGMMVQELETAKRLRLTPLLIVLCDRSLAVIKIAQDIRKIPYRGVGFEPVDWATVADGFGAKGVTASDPEEVSDAIGHWLASPELTVLAAQVDDALYAGLTY